MNQHIHIDKGDDSSRDMLMDGNPSKRLRSEDDSALHSVISPRVFQEIDTIVDSYRNASPYPHGIIHDIFVHGFLGMVIYTH